MTEYTALIIYLIAFVLLINVFLMRFTGGSENNILNIFLTATHVFYLLLTPVVYFYQKNFYAVNANVEDYWATGLLQILIYLFIFYFVYYLNLDKSPRIRITQEEREFAGSKIGWYIFAIFSLLYLIIFFNTLAAGINIFDIFMGSYGEPTLGLRGGSYYLQNFADSLITLLVLAYCFRIRRLYFVLMYSSALPLFLVLGFRYRLLLVFFPVFLIYVYDRGFKFRSVLRFSITILIFFYSLMLITANRSAIFMQKFDDFSFDYSEFPYDAVFDQAKGSLMDFAMYKAVDEGRVGIDYGETMFGHIFVKMTPKFLFDGEIKPVPPILSAIDTSINAGREIGEAVTGLGGAFHAFYYPGIYIMAIILGYIVARLQNTFSKGPIQMVISLMSAMAIFQWLTRGYFPQTVDHFAYMMFPLIVVWHFNRKKYQIRKF